MLLEDALPHWQLARGADWERSQSGENAIVIVIVIGNNTVRMLLKTTTINASFFTYLFVNSGGIFLLWGAIVEAVDMPWASRFALDKTQVFGSLKLIMWFFLDLKFKKNFAPTVQRTLKKNTFFYQRCPGRYHSQLTLQPEPCKNKSKRKKQIPKNSHPIPTQPDSSLQRCGKLTFGRKKVWILRHSIVWTIWVVQYQAIQALATLDYICREVYINRAPFLRYF